MFSALSQSPAQLQGLIDNANAVFGATAAQDVALAATVKAFPSFLAQTRSTIDRVGAFASATKPLIDELRPATAQLTAALQALPGLAPELRDLLVNLAPLTSASRAGMPALEQFLEQSEPVLARLGPYLGGVVPVVNYINDYAREIAAFFANSTAATQAILASAYGGNLHYLRISNPINPEVLTAYQKRLTTNRPNPYLEPGGYAKLPQGLPVFGGYLCTKNPPPTFGPSLSSTTTTLVGQVLTLAQLLQTYYYTADPNGPPCKAQSPLGTVTTGQLQAFPHLKPLP